MSHSVELSKRLVGDATQKQKLGIIKLTYMPARVQSGMSTFTGPGALDCPLMVAVVALPDTDDNREIIRALAEIYAANTAAITAEGGMGVFESVADQAFERKPGFLPILEKYGFASSLKTMHAEKQAVEQQVGELQEELLATDLATAAHACDALGQIQKKYSSKKPKKRFGGLFSKKPKAADQGHGAGASPKR
jgi:hypothetical protein